MPLGSAGANLKESYSPIEKAAFAGRRGGGAHFHGGGGGHFHGGGAHWSGGGARWGGWARPGRYWWPAGGAVAAGAAIGFVSAATAAAWAGAAPGPNMCWYYTDASRTKGFWDGCQ
jgi:hypothetical protein